MLQDCTASYLQHFKSSKLCNTSTMYSFNCSTASSICLFSVLANKPSVLQNAFKLYVSSLTWQVEIEELPSEDVWMRWVEFGPNDESWLYPPM
jgi:hypothetical protein